jgi:hypothetical protein
VRKVSSALEAAAATVSSSTSSTIDVQHQAHHAATTTGHTALLHGLGDVGELFVSLYVCLGMSLVHFSMAP